MFAASIYYAIRNYNTAIMWKSKLVVDRAMTEVDNCLARPWPLASWTVGGNAYLTRFSLLRSNRQMNDEARKYVAKNDTIQFDLSADSFYGYHTAEEDSPSTDPFQWWHLFSHPGREDERPVNLSKKSEFRRCLGDSSLPRQQ